MNLTLLFRAFMPLCYWVESFYIVIFLINCLPSKVLKDWSPHNQIMFLWWFGCIYFPWLHPYNKNKLEFRSKPCIFFGCNLNHHRYRCPDVVIGHIFLYRHVVFNYQVFPSRTITPSSCHFALNNPNSLAFPREHYGIST